MKKIILILATLFMAISCDIVEEPYKQELTTAGEFKKNVLIFDFTAINCVFCPTANQVAESLSDLYGHDNVIVIGAHSSSLAVPLKDKNQVDFRSEPSTELYDKFAKGEGLPLGMVNLRDIDGRKITNFGNWDGMVIEESYLEPEMDLTMELIHEEGSQDVEIEITADFFEASNSDDNICIYVTEDSLISDQKDNGVIIENYVHDHVLRASVTGTFGTQFTSNDINSGESFSKSYNYTIPDEYNAKKLRFVAFIMNKNTNYIKQVTAKYLYEKSE